MFLVTLGLRAGFRRCPGNCCLGGKWIAMRRRPWAAYLVGSEPHGIPTVAVAERSREWAVAVEPSGLFPQYATPAV